MKINPVNSYNVGFKGEKKENRYLKWVSQNEANTALINIKGREERNGKFKLAGAVLTLGGLIATGIGFLRLAKNPSASLKTPIAGLAAITLGTIVQSVNKMDALRTAKERGFTRGSVNMDAMPRSFEKAYNETEKIYKANVSQT